MTGITDLSSASLITCATFLHRLMRCKLQMVGNNAVKCPLSMSSRALAGRSQLTEIDSWPSSIASCSGGLQVLASNGLSVGPVNDLHEALQLDVVQERNLFLDPLGAQGGQPLLRSPLDRKAQGLRRQPPRLGEHSADILAKLGNSADWPLDETSPESR